MRKRTPWGKPDDAIELAEGIIGYSTPSHGGIWLSSERRNELRKLGINENDNFLKSMEWWEEDVDWAIPYSYFAEDIKRHGNAYMFDENLKAANMTLQHWKKELI